MKVRSIILPLIIGLGTVFLLGCNDKETGPEAYYYDVTEYLLQDAVEQQQELMGARTTVIKRYSNNLDSVGSIKEYQAVHKDFLRQENSLRSRIEQSIKDYERLMRIHNIIALGSPRPRPIPIPPPPPPCDVAKCMNLNYLAMLIYPIDDNRYGVSVSTPDSDEPIAKVTEPVEDEGLGLRVSTLTFDNPDFSGNATLTYTITAPNGSVDSYTTNVSIAQ